MKIKMKFILQSLVIFLLILVSSLVILPKFLQIKSSWNFYVNNVMTRIKYVSYIKSEAGYGGAIHNFKNLVLRGNKKYADRFYKNYDNVVETVKKYKSLESVNPEEIKDLDVFVSVLTQYKTMVPVILEKYNQVDSIKKLDEMVKINDSPAVKALKDLNKFYNRLIQQETKLVNKNISTAITYMGIAAVIMFLLIILTNIFLAKSIFARIKDMAFATDKIAEGDFTTRAKSNNKDELSMLQNKFVDVIAQVDEKLTNVIYQISTAGDSIMPLMNHVSEISKAVSTSTEVAHQVATAGQEMNATISEIAANTNDSVNMTDMAVDVAAKGGELISKASEFSEIAGEKMRNLSLKVESLKNEADKIGGVVNVINDLSDQTNLLALNAAIEAARAGEAGRGFAVVADEVRKLAERTQSATNEIASVISQIQTDIQATVQEAADAVKSVEEQKNLTEEANESFTQIFNNIQEVNALIGSISAAIEEQSATTSEISNSIEDLSRDTQSLDRLTVDLMDASGQLVNSINYIDKELGQFKVSNPSAFFIMNKITHAILLKDIYNCVITGDCNVKLTDHRNCSFGKYYYSDECQKQYGHIRAFKDIEIPHQAVHKAAQDVIQALNSNDNNEIHEKLAVMEKEAENFMESINQLINQLKQM